MDIWLNKYFYVSLGYLEKYEIWIYFNIFKKNSKNFEKKSNLEFKINPNNVSFHRSTFTVGRSSSEDITDTQLKSL